MLRGNCFDRSFMFACGIASIEVRAAYLYGVQFCLWQDTLLLRIIERLARAEKTSLLFQECIIFHHSDLFDERTSHSLAKKQLLFEKLLNNQEVGRRVVEVACYSSISHFLLSSVCPSHQEEGSDSSINLSPGL
ncbi:GC-rich sequence DNA-binding factor-like protein [Striga asiatica]|uniref:GC-rich sequence DNA-binding factor-like protein n=1 Tax=Striga asiatica TaxID=4170 RepID=A0A5A7QLL4_STRAF|nr:GC-rich sequence DNA-binding factor-like protein [Striga asiatica]